MNVQRDAKTGDDWQEILLDVAIRAGKAMSNVKDVKVPFEQADEFLAMRSRAAEKQAVARSSICNRPQCPGRDRQWNKSAELDALAFKKRLRGPVVMKNIIKTSVKNGLEQIESAPTVRSAHEV